MVILFRLLLAFLVTATLLWGGCQSCPRFFMFPWENTGSPQKHCCSTAGKCSRTSDKAPQESSTSSGKTCKRIALESAEKIILAVPADFGFANSVLAPEPVFAGYLLATGASSPPGECSFSILRI